MTELIGYVIERAASDPDFLFRLLLVCLVFHMLTIIVFFHQNR